MTTLTFATVRELGLSLPGVVDGTAYGAPALKFERKILACVPTSKSAEDNSVVVHIDVERRAQLLEQHPDTYYITDHYDPYPSVLVRLSKITRDELGALLAEACAFISPPRTSPIAGLKKQRTKGPAKSSD
jgi:hypothetical protein